MYDVAVIGAGPAGLSASIALACEGKTVVVLEKSDTVGGQIKHSHLVENVVGYRQGFSGEDFAVQAYEQAIGCGVNIKLDHEVLMLDMLMSNGPIGFALYTQHLIPVRARTVLVTVGVTPRPIPFDVGDGCGCTITNDLHLLPATPDEHVVVYGGGNSAGQAAVYYAKQGCSKVTLLSRRPVEETMDARWIFDMLGRGVELVVGEIQHVNDTVVFQNSGEVQRIIPHTVHAFMGGEPETGWLQGWVEFDEHGYIITDDTHCTATYGLYAAGDCESRSVKKFTCAVGGACEAVPAIGRCLSGL